MPAGFIFATNASVGPLLDAFSGATVGKSTADVRPVMYTFPDASVAPYVMLQASDSRHFATISANVYRFLPFDLRQDELQSIHGIDERIRTATYRRSVAFFDALVGRL